MDIFILGVERSGTTWLSNILESHPQTDVFMEPLSIHISYFSKWPNRFVDIIEKEIYAQYFIKEFDKLKKRKRLFLSKIKDARINWDIDYFLASKINDRIPNSYMRDFLELNFHRFGNDFHFYKQNVKKKVIKELRLNFNPDIIKYINNSAKILVIIRPFWSTIMSIKNNSEKGRLVELNKLLKNVVSSNNLYINYFDYWLNSYNSLLYKLDQTHMEYHVIYHDALIANHNRIMDIFNYLNLDWNSNVSKYLEYSIQRGVGSQNTNRDPEQLKKKEESYKNFIYKELNSYICKTKSHNLHPNLKRFFN